MWIIFVAMVGVVGFYMYAGGAGAKKLECPACDLYIVGARASQGDSVVCPHCRAVGLYEAGKLIAPAPDHVAAKAVFCCELPQGAPHWPPHCVLCSQPATRGVPMHLVFEQDADFGLDLATRMASLGTVKLVDKHTVTLEIPHCAAHSDGATLVMPYEREQPNFGVAFRSYPTFKEFVALNHVTPRKRTMFGGQVEG